MSIKINENCKYLEEQNNYIDMFDDLYTNPQTSYYCNEKKEYVISCPMICKYKQYADCGGHYNPSKKIKCFLCENNATKKIKTEEMLNKNIMKIFCQEDKKIYDVCDDCSIACKTNVKEIIGFKGFGEALSQVLHYKI